MARLELVIISNKNYTLLNSSRFYLLAATALLSLLALGVVRTAVPNDQLFYIRLQQVYGLLSVLYLYVALLVSPLKAAIGDRLTRGLTFNRRAIGVSAFYFALLHAAVALWGQLGGWQGLAYLPEIFRWSLLGGVVSLSVLALLAATSFDRVVKRMTFKWWKLMHRLVYGAGLLVLLHIWSIGTHLAYSYIQIIAFVMLVSLFGLEIWKVLKAINQKYSTFNRGETLLLFLCAWVTISGAVAIIPVLVGNYHSRHTVHETSQTEGAL